MWNEICPHSRSEYITFAEQIFHSEAISLARRANFVEKSTHLSTKTMCAFFNEICPAGKWNSFAVKYLLRKCEIFADANVGKFHFTLRRRSNISQFPQGNYFTFGNAEYFTKIIPQQKATPWFIGESFVGINPLRGWNLLFVGRARRMTQYTASGMHTWWNLPCGRLNMADLISSEASAEDFIQNPLDFILQSRISLNLYGL